MNQSELNLFLEILESDDIADNNKKNFYVPDKCKECEIDECKGTYIDFDVYHDVEKCEITGEEVNSRYIGD